VDGRDKPGHDGEIIMDKLAVDQPNYASYRRELGE